MPASLCRLSFEGRRSRGGSLAEWAVAGVDFLAGGAESVDAETGRRPVGGAHPPGRVVRSKGTGEAESARSERADWGEWVGSERRTTLTNGAVLRHGWDQETLQFRFRVTHWAYSAIALRGLGSVDLQLRIP